MGEKKSKDEVITVVLKIDLPCGCEGCPPKHKKDILSIKGVDSVKWGDGNKVTVIGKVDPFKLREEVEQKTHRKVKLISAVQEKNKGKEPGAGDHKKDKPKENPSPEVKKSKETTAVMKVDLRCEGSIENFRRIVKKNGCQVTSIDLVKNLVTVTGSMDMKALAKSLKEQLKKEVEIVPAKEKGGGGKDGKKEKDGGDDQGKGGGEGPKVVVLIRVS